MPWISSSSTTLRFLRAGKLGCAGLRISLQDSWGSCTSEIVRERLEREYDLSLLATAPSVVYRVMLTDGSRLDIQNPKMWPPPQRVEAVEEPYVRASMMVPNEFVGTVMELCREKRGQYVNMEYLTAAGDDNL